MSYSESIYAPVHNNPLVKVDVTHSILKLRIPEIRFSKSEAICEIKCSLTKRLGTPPEDMKLVLKNYDGQAIAHMDDELKPFGFYNPLDGHIVHVVDTNPISKLLELQDVSQVQKYVMADEDYDALPNSVRQFLKRLRANNPEFFMKSAAITVDDNYMQQEISGYKVGDRCQVLESGNRGEVGYVGKCPDMGQGYWVGVKLDEPYGSGNGYLKGVQYFVCMPKYGNFLRPDKIEVGDFPEIDEFDEI